MVKKDCINLPDYIVERDRRGKDAGLIIERRDTFEGVTHKNTLSTWYRGSAEQFAAAGIVLDLERLRRAKGKKTIGGSGIVHVYSPDHIYGSALRFERLGADDLRLRVQERLPVEAAEIKGGIKVYWFSKVSYLPQSKVFVAGSGKTLVDAGVAPAEIVDILAENGNCPTKWGEGYNSKGEPARVELWTVRQDRSGVVLFEVYPEAQASVAQRERNRGKFNFEDVEALRDFLVQWTASHVEGMLETFGHVETHSGEVYELPKTSRDAIESAVLNLRHVMENMRITACRAPDPREADIKKALRKLPEARADGDFQRFMQRLQPGARTRRT